MRAKLRPRKKILKGFAAICHNIMEQAEKEGKVNLEEQKAIRDYLLGALSDKSEMRRIEEKILLEDDFVEELSIAEDQLIDEYLDGALNASEEKSFDQYFLNAPERKQKLRLIRNLRKYAAGSEKQNVRQIPKEKSRYSDWRRLISLPGFRLAAASLLVLLFGFAIWRTVFYQSDAEKGLVQLQIAYRGQRPTKSRSTANFGYAPVTVTRGNTQTITDRNAYNLATIYLGEAIQNHPADSDAQHNLGLFYFAEKNFDDALKHFNNALEKDPNNAKLNNDVGAVYLEKANSIETEERGDEILGNSALALKFFNRATELDNSLLEAVFNKALVLQKMRLTNEARKAWEEYLQKDPSSPWASEARENLERLKEQSHIQKDKSQILRDFLDAFQRRDDAGAWEIASQTKELITGIMIQQQLAQKFLEANQQSRKEEADKILSAFVYLGELEKQNAGDLFFSELVTYYKNTDQVQRQKLFEAHEKLRAGHELIVKPNFKQALEVLHNAKSLFIETGNIWEASIADYQIYYCFSRVDRIKESNEKLSALSDFAGQRNFRWLQVLADGWVAETYFFLGEFSKASFYNQKSLSSAQEISDNYNIRRILVQLTEQYKAIGEPRKALFFTYRNLTFSDSYYTFPRQRWRDLNYATETLYRFRFYDAAAAFGEEATDFAQNKVKDNLMFRTSRRNLALIYGSLKKFKEASEHIDSVFQMSQTFTDEAMKKRLVANSLQVSADLQRQAGDCQKAVENYNQAIQTYQEMEFVGFKYNAIKGRLFCSMSQQNNAAVKEEFAALLQEFDKDRKKLNKEDDRNAFFNAEQEVYDAAINYAYTTLKDAEQSFNYAENSRARSLLNLVRGSSELIQPLSLGAIRENMPDLQMIYYAVLPDKILIWHVSKTNFTVFEKPFKQDELENKILDYTKILIEKKDEASVTYAAKELYALLIEPLETALEKDKSLCIVADKSLFQLPFSSLISPKTNKYLIEDYALLSAPSATVFINETEISRQKSAAQGETVLSIGNPAFSNKEYIELKDLPSARREAEEIAPLYDSPRVFVDEEAVKQQIVNNLDEADVVHFAGHYVPNSTSPSLSKLLLAKGDLTVEEIMEKKLSRPRLVVLSACETGVEKFYNGEGMIGAARAFLASDIPLVVASQWSVDSAPTAELMINFHRYRKQQGLPTIAALRQAQIDMLDGEDTRFRQPYYWAGFLPIGGFANY